MRRGAARSMTVLHATEAASVYAEADRLTAWLDGTPISSVYTSVQMRSAALRWPWHL
jgi:hypothetical protein